MKISKLIITLLLFSYIVFGQEKFHIYEVSEHIGENASVYGKVVQIYKDKADNYYLLFGGKFPDNLFSVIINKSANFSSDAVYKYFNYLIIVKGAITLDEYKKPAIVVKNKNQLSFFTEDDDDK